ncbi:GNAT family N-acetyltransferase [Xylanimonas protaetiae]|nr:N-acetyltransferase [Xylanimonas protaetiae]
MPNVVVLPLTELPADRRAEVARVFAAAYATDLATISRDTERWAAALAPAFVADVCFVALDGDAVVGVAACSHGTTRALRLDPRALRRHLGVVRGTFASLAMGRTFHHRLPYPASTGYVECVATDPAARGRGVATTLMDHLHALPYDDFVLEVTDTNERARALYTRLGYTEHHRRRSRLPWLTGYREALYLTRAGNGARAA